MTITLEPLLFRAGQAIDLEIIQPLRAWTVARQAITANPNIKGEGIYSVDAIRLADAGPATISYQLPRPNDIKDAPRLSRENVQLPILRHQIEIDRKEFNALQNYAGGSIDITRIGANSQAYQMAVLEDALVFQGWKADGTNYAISGFYNASTTQYTTSTSFGNGSYYGNFNKMIGAAIGSLKAYGVKPPNGCYHLFMNAADYSWLDGIISSLGVKEMDAVLKTLNHGAAAGPGGIWELPSVTITDPGTSRTQTITAMAQGTALLMPDDPTRTWYEEYVIQDVKTSLGYDSRDPNNSPIYSTMTSIVYPHLKQPHAGCQITTLVQA
jgi:uncharacterized linocin/CFP29 family protein